jgi:hypothetical protein
MDNNITLLQNENRELKESNCKLAKQIQELEKNLKMQSMKLEYVTIFLLISEKPERFRQSNIRM